MRAAPPIRRRCRFATTEEEKRMARGDRRRGRWKKDRQRKKRERDRRKAEAKGAARK